MGRGLWLSLTSAAPSPHGKWGEGPRPDAQPHPHRPDRAGSGTLHSSRSRNSCGRPRPLSQSYRRGGVGGASAAPPAPSCLGFARPHHPTRRGREKAPQLTRSGLASLAPHSAPHLLCVCLLFCPAPPCWHEVVMEERTVPSPSTPPPLPHCQQPRLDPASKRRRWRTGAGGWLVEELNINISGVEGSWVFLKREWGHL